MEAVKERLNDRNDELSPASCLGLEWETSEIGKIKIHNQNHIKEVMAQLESSSGSHLRKESAPDHPKCHSELEETRLLGDEEIIEHQKYADVLQWVQPSLRSGVTLAVSSLARH